jgi:septal ring factor EnvC (AmiA/AmiB activator)
MITTDADEINDRIEEVTYEMRMVQGQLWQWAHGRDRLVAELDELTTRLRLLLDEKRSIEQIYAEIEGEALNRSWVDERVRVVVWEFVAGG